MYLPTPAMAFIGLLIVIIIITVTTTNSYHTWTGRSHYCANCGSKKCNCGKKERYTTGCGCGA